VEDTDTHQTENSFLSEEPIIKEVDLRRIESGFIQGYDLSLLNDLISQMSVQDWHKRSSTIK
jgi:hypothetical protein